MTGEVPGVTGEAPEGDRGEQGPPCGQCPCLPPATRLLQPTADKKPNVKRRHDLAVPPFDIRVPLAESARGLSGPTRRPGRPYCRAGPLTVAPALSRGPASDPSAGTKRRKTAPGSALRSGRGDKREARQAARRGGAFRKTRRRGPSLQTETRPALCIRHPRCKSADASIDACRDAVGDARDGFARTERQNRFAAAGYDRC